MEDTLRIENWNCKHYSVCLTVAAVENAETVGCDSCEEYEEESFWQRYMFLLNHETGYMRLIEELWEESHVPISQWRMTPLPLAAGMHQMPSPY